MLVFFAILLAGYIYVWRKGVLDWGHERPDATRRKTDTWLISKSPF